MQTTLIIVISLHVLAGVLWAGTSFTLARTGGAAAERLFRPQMGAAVIAVLTGGYLWHLLHEGGFGTTEKVLALGALCAVAAAGVQGAMGAAATRKLARAGRCSRALARRPGPADRGRSPGGDGGQHGRGALRLRSARFYTGKPWSALTSSITV
jgi:hypothetical protein